MYFPRTYNVFGRSLLSARPFIPNSNSTKFCYFNHPPGPWSYHHPGNDLDRLWLPLLFFVFYILSFCSASVLLGRLFDIKACLYCSCIHIEIGPISVVALFTALLILYKAVSHASALLSLLLCIQNQSSGGVPLGGCGSESLLYHSSDLLSISWLINETIYSDAFWDLLVFGLVLLHAPL